MPKQARIVGIKSYRCYTPAEAAELVGVSVRTIRNWTRNGLMLLDSERPALIRGDDLRNYIQEQRKGRKVQIGLCEFYCLRCRTSREAAEAMADCKITGNRATLTALCKTCETVICKPVALARLPELRRILDLTITRDDATL